MEEKESSPSLRWGKRKLWVAVAALEFAAILILVAGLAHFAAHHERATETGNWGEGSNATSSLASLGTVNRTLQAAAKRWESCQNRTRALEANASSLSSEMTQIKTRLGLEGTGN
ncbi:Hypothetical predicted protein [Podarcis lilfordi]|uniref:Uncharacterized protein n=1 Tax=Podarcis lilfordi TaxID=74358 RepID=A0AA35QRI8_9SAUR|nr:Hypothetical predicted protein [Podarcis lilfordi]